MTRDHENSPTLVATVLAAGLACCALLACDRRTPAAAIADASLATPTPPDAQASRIDDLRESARATLTRTCGECHDPTRDTSLARALAIFDVREADWSRRMTVRQLREANRRLRQTDVPTRDETLGARPIQVSDDERARFTEFLELELDRRGVCPRGRASCVDDPSVGAGDAG